MTVHELKIHLDAGTAVLLDIREPEELTISRLDPCRAIPMAEIAQRLGELDPTQAIAVICRSGHRSQIVTDYLRGMGFARAQNVEGGINAWAKHIDPALPTY